MVKVLLMVGIAAGSFVLGGFCYNQTVNEACVYARAHNFDNQVCQKETLKAPVSK